jgi:hypothetical protein
MEDQEYLDEQDFDSSEDTETEAQGEDGEETTPNKNKNKSNFNSLYKKTKELESTLANKDVELANALAELEEWRNLNPEVQEERLNKTELQKMEEKIFTIENPETKPYLKEIRATMKEYGCDYQKAWKLVKIDLPEESKTKVDFNI